MSVYKRLLAFNQCRHSKTLIFGTCTKKQMSKGVWSYLLAQAIWITLWGGKMLKSSIVSKSPKICSNTIVWSQI